MSLFVVCTLVWDSSIAIFSDKIRNETTLDTHLVVYKLIIIYLFLLRVEVEYFVTLSLEIDSS